LLNVFVKELGARFSLKHIRLIWQRKLTYYCFHAVVLTPYTHESPWLFKRLTLLLLQFAVDVLSLEAMTLFCFCLPVLLSSDLGFGLPLQL
jgi:hypothetical protein